MSTIGDISTRTKWLVSKRYIQAVIIVTLMTLAIAVPLFTRAFALTDVGNAGVFELDGNIVRDGTSTDWGNGPGGMGLFSSTGATNALPLGGLDAHWVNDGPHSVPDNTTYTTGSKDTLDINANWACTPSNNITPKDDILHSYSFAIVPQSGLRAGHVLVYGGFERFANNGAGDLGFWLLQDPTVSCSSTKGAVSFTGVHVVGDILTVGEFSTGGSVTTLNEFEWVGISKATPLGVVNITATGGADCTVAPVAANVCARSNTGPISTPWSTQDKTSGSNTLATAEFFEVGIDLTGLLGQNAPCINRFIFDTRTSPTLTATLVDYAQGGLTTCATSAISTTVSPSTIALGQSATDTATVTLTPGGQTVSGTVTFNVYGPFNSAPTSTSCTSNSLVTPFSPNTVSIGPATSPQSATSGSFTPSAPGYYAWIATYNPTGPRNGNTVSTACGDAGETLLVIDSSITTSVSPTPITLGGSATDTATVTVTSGGTVGGMVTFNSYASLSDCNAGTNSKFTDTKSVSGSSPASVTSAAFTPTAPGKYYWIAAYGPSGAINGPPASTTCGDANEILVVFGIPKITAFDFTNTPTNNDPTLGSGSVTYSFTIHNYGASAVTLSGTFVVSSPNGASVTCTGSNTLSGSLAAFGSSGDSATFSMTCTYSGTSGQKVEADIDAMFTVAGGVAHEVSGSPATYTFTIETT